MAEENPILLELRPDGVAVVTLDRPKRRNAMNPDMIARLSDTFDALAASDAVRCVVLRANGVSFSAGADIEHMRAAGGFTEEENYQDALALAHMLDKLYRLEPVTVALVQGACIGGGCGLVAACDVAVAESQAIFRFSEVRLGIIPAVISPFVLEAIGPRQGRRLFATADSFGAEEARHIGLTHAVVEGEAALEAEGVRLSTLALEAAPGAVADAKALVGAVAHRSIDADLIAEVARSIANRRASLEGREGLAAFLEKRKPSWVS